MPRQREFPKRRRPTRVHERSRWCHSVLRVVRSVWVSNEKKKCEPPYLTPCVWQQIHSVDRCIGSWIHQRRPLSHCTLVLVCVSCCLRFTVRVP